MGMFYRSHNGNSEGKAQNIHRALILAIPQVLILYACMLWTSDWSFFWVLLELLAVLGGLLASFMSLTQYLVLEVENPLGAGTEGSLHDGKEMTTSSFWKTLCFTSWFYFFHLVWFHVHILTITLLTQEAEGLSKPYPVIFYFNRISNKNYFEQ